MLKYTVPYLTRLVSYENGLAQCKEHSIILTKAMPKKELVFSHIRGSTYFPTIIAAIIGMAFLKHVQ
jgi:hypothetical protein